MKNSYKLLIALAAFATAFTSCSKEITNPDAIEDGIKVTIHSGAPATKTAISGTTPYWCDGDAIGVSTGAANNNAKFEENSIADNDTAETATFSGTVSATGTYYAYYPYTSNGVSASGAKVDIPSTQNPTAASFDGSADVMVSKSFEISTTESTTIENLEFKRLGAIVKVVLKDGSDTYDLSNEQPISVSLTAESNLVGRVYVDMVNQELGSIYYNASPTVTAEYTSSTKFAIDGSNAAYFVVYPQTLTAGTTLNVSATTDSYTISKDINVPDGGIVFEGGAVTVLNVNIEDSHIAASSAGASLPFVDDMSWLDNVELGSNVDFSSSIASNSNGLYSAATKTYKENSVLKIGSSKAVGSITTKDLDLSGQFYILVQGANYGSDTGTLIIHVDDAEVYNQSFASINYVNISASTYTKKSKVTITTSEKRAYIYSVEIRSGSYVPNPEITVTSDNPIAAVNTGDVYTIEYTIANPTNNTSINATSNVTWINTFDYDIDGEVSFVVDAQESGADARSGVVTLSYGNATDVQVTVNQAAADGVESVVYTLTPAEGSNNSYASSCDVEISDITWNVTGNASLTPWRIGGKSITGVDRTIYSKTAINYNISKIEITHGAASSITVNSMTVVVASDADFSTVVSTLTPTFAANNTVTVERPDGVAWSKCYYKFIYNVTVSSSNNKFVEFSEAKFTGK